MEPNLTSNLTSKVDQLNGMLQTWHTKYGQKLETMQSQLDAIDLKAQGYFPGHVNQSSLSETMKDNESLHRLLRDKKGSAVMSFAGEPARQLLERKTTMTSATVGSSSTGVLPIGRLAGITQEARQALTVRDVLSASPTTFQIIDFVKVNTPMAIASPQVEGSAKFENALGLTTASARVTTIATWIPASKQLLDDYTELTQFLETSLGYYVDLAEEIQLLSGDGTGVNLNGLITQASAFNMSLVSVTKGWNKIDLIGRACQQITAVGEMPPTFIVLNPNDWWDIRLSKDGFGRYILGDPQTGAGSAMMFGSLKPVQALFDLQVVPTNSIASGTFLVGSGNPVASEIKDRMELQIEVSTEHADFFTRNLIAIRAEKRLALVVRRPASYIHGSFSNSPA